MKFVVTTATLTAVIGVLVGLLVSVQRPAQPIPPAPSSGASSSSEVRPPAAEFVETHPDPVVVAELRGHRDAAQSRRREYRRDRTRPPGAAADRAGCAARQRRPLGAGIARQRSAASRHRDRISDRPRRADPDQPPRHRRRRAPHREAGGWPEPSGGCYRLRSGHRHCADQGVGQRAVPPCGARRFVEAARR